MEDSFFEESLNAEKLERHGFGSIRSSFFYLEMPHIYPLLYHECAHLQFAWEEISRKNRTETGLFFRTRNDAFRGIRDTFQRHNINIDAIENFIEEIWIDTISIALGGLPYFTALTMQIFSQSSSTLFDANNNLAIQKWGEKPIFDITYFFNSPEPNHIHEYFWSTRLKLAEFCLNELHPQEYDDNKDWIETVREAIQLYYNEGLNTFAEELTSKKHETWWKYKIQINQWLFKAIKIQLEKCHQEIKRNIRRPLSQKYRLDKKAVETLVVPPVKKFEKKLFDLEEYTIPMDKNGTRIEYIPFSIRWNLSKHVINVLDENNLENYTLKYTDHIRNDGSAIFRLAIEWVMARNDLYATFANYIDHPNIVEIHFKKIYSENDTIFKDIKNILRRLNNHQKSILSDDLNYHRIFTDSKNWNFLKIKGLSYTNKNIIFYIKKLVNKYLNEQILPQLQCHGDSEVAISTMALGIISKRLLANQENGGYFKSMKIIHEFYKNKINGLNENMPTCMGTNNRYSYDQINIGDAKNSTPQKAALYFLSGEYDFLFYQERITPTEASFHPQHLPPLLTKPRVLIEIGCNGDKYERKAWGRISLLSFRYRWEIYHLKTELEKSNTRYRLWLSSAWEDGILATWHDNNDEFWSDGFEQFGITTEEISTIDIQTNIMLCKLDENGKDLYSACGHSPIIIPEMLNDQNSLIDFFKSMSENKTLLSKFRLMLGRGDYLLRWSAKSPEELTNAFLQIPPKFWSYINHMRTTLTRLPPLSDSEAKENKEAIRRPRFSTEVSAKIFPTLRTKK